MPPNGHGMKTFQRKAPRSTLTADTRGVAAIEFAISGSALFLFLFGIMNLGELGFTIIALQRGVQQAARYASVATSVALANGTAVNNACTTQADAQTQFANAVTPPLSAASTPIISISWGGSLATCSNDASNGIGTVTISARYRWYPIGMAGLLTNGISLAPTETLAVMNTGSQGTGP
jgi:Flp pilus assembly protein TadG